MCQVFKRIRTAGGRIKEVFIGVTKDSAGSVPSRWASTGGETDRFLSTFSQPTTGGRQHSKGASRPKYPMNIHGVRVR